MSVTHKKDASRVLELEAQVQKLEDDIKQKEEILSEQITNTQLALYEIFESVMNMESEFVKLLEASGDN